MTLPEKITRYPAQDAPFRSDPIADSSKEAADTPQDPELAQRMERWGKVYFSAPPDQRDMLVKELLQEFQDATSDTADSVESFQERRETEGDLGTNVSTESVTEVCPNCARENANSQKFCGFCGALMQTAPQAPIAQTEFFVANTDPPTNGHETVHSIADSADLDWLRGRTLPSILEVEEPKRSVAWGRIFVVLALLVGGTLFYMHRRQWVDRIDSVIKRATGSSQAPTQSLVQPAQSAAVSSPPSPQAPNEQSKAGAETDVHSVSQSSAEKGSHSSPESREKSGAQANTEAPSSAPLRSAADVEKMGDDSESPKFVGGTEELTLAERFLAPPNGSRDSAQAAKWLWRSVGKQNGRALVLLSDLYAQGDGVPKSCDQARLLLIAAAKKEVAEAGPKLRAMETAGCR